MAQPINLLDKIAFIPFAAGIDAEQFSDFDEMTGLSACLYIEEGIICTLEDEATYIDLMSTAVKYFADGEED